MTDRVFLRDPDQKIYFETVTEDGTVAAIAYDRLARHAHTIDGPVSRVWTRDGKSVECEVLRKD